MECRISDIERGRVRLMGTIVEKDSSKGVVSLDDGSGQVKVFFDQVELLDSIGDYENGDRVFVCGWAMDEGVSGDIIKSAHELDLGLYEKVWKQWSSLCEPFRSDDDV